MRLYSCWPSVKLGNVQDGNAAASDGVQAKLKISVVGVSNLTSREIPVVGEREDGRRKICEIDLSCDMSVHSVKSTHTCFQITSSGRTAGPATVGSVFPIAVNMMRSSEPR